MSRTVAFLAMRAFALYRSRRPLMGRLRDAGWRVVAICEDDDFGDTLRIDGHEVVHVPFHARGRALRGLIGLRVDLRNALCRLAPDLVHAFNAVPVLLGGLPGGAPRPRTWLNTVTGLGRGFQAGGVRTRLVRLGYRVALHRADHTVFQNSADRAAVLAPGDAAADRTSVILGSGVDTDAFCPAGTPRTAGPARVLMVGRLLGRKGVRAYADAARAVKTTHPDVEFLLAGEHVDGDPDAVPRDWLEARVAAGDLRFLGYRDDLQALLPTVDLLVHPTLYAEGLPRILLEAGACGLPVVTVDGPGRSEAVRPGETGLLLPREEIAERLPSSLRDLLDAPERCADMGRAARRHVVAHHDIRAITDRYASLYASLGIRI